MSVDFIDRHRQIIPGAQHRAAKFQYLNRRHRYPKLKQRTNVEIELAEGVEENPSTDRFSGIYMSARKLKSNWRGRHITEMVNARQYLHALASRDHLGILDGRAGLLMLAKQENRSPKSRQYAILAR